MKSYVSGGEDEFARVVGCHWMVARWPHKDDRSWMPGEHRQAAPYCTEYSIVLTSVNGSTCSCTCACAWRLLPAL
jgi:hypothetical protein